jgi:hypothetical protein
MRRNIESVLGPNPLLWCCPSRTPGSGLKYELSNYDGEWNELSAFQPRDTSHDLEGGSCELGIPFSSLIALQRSAFLFSVFLHSVNSILTCLFIS